MNAPQNPRIRLRYAKSGKVRFLSHRDMARVAERAIRRGGIPVAYSEGFSPRPKLHFGLALSTGYCSDAEFLDLDLDPERDGVREPEAIRNALQECMPQGVDMTAAAHLAAGEPSLQDAVTSTSWFVEAAADPTETAQLGDDLLAVETCEVEIVRKGKQVREDLRPLLLNLRASAVEEGSVSPGVRVLFELGTKPRSIRPAELLEVLGISEPTSVRRTHQWIQRDGSRFEPLALDEPSPHALVRAS